MEQDYVQTIKAFFASVLDFTTNMASFYKDSEENSLEEKTNFQELLKSIFYPIYKYLSEKNFISITCTFKIIGRIIAPSTYVL